MADPTPIAKAAPTPKLASGLAAAMRAQAGAVRRVADPQNPANAWYQEPAASRRARINAALGTESVDAAGLSGNHLMTFLMAGWREEIDHTGRRIALHPPDPSAAPAGPRPLTPAPAPAPERPYRGTCLTPGCSRGVRRVGDKFCGALACREVAKERERALGRDRSRTLYAQNPALYIQRTIASRRRKRQRDRFATRTHLRRCHGGRHWFEVVDGRRATCGDPDHQKAHQREQNRIRQARCYARHLRAPRRAHRP
jgi:hypothetical protein